MLRRVSIVEMNSLIKYSSTQLLVET